MEGSKQSEDLSRRFVSQREVDERNKKRQEEWERVRKPEDPIEVPDVPIDNRTLYERLQEQKEKERLEKEEPLKFKNQIHRLDDEEAVFLDMVSQQQEALHAQRDLEEFRLISEMQNQSTVASQESLQTLTKPKVKAADSASASRGKSQQSLLASAVKRKGSVEQAADPQKKSKEEEPEANRTSASNSGAMTVVGILPGIGTYSDSSDDSSDSSASSNIDVNIMDAFKNPIITQIEKVVSEQQ